MIEPSAFLTITFFEAKTIQRPYRLNEPRKWALFCQDCLQAYDKLGKPTHE